jgi:putative addiction module killer protein
LRLNNTLTGEARPRNVSYYEPRAGESFESWLNGLRDRKAQAKIDTRLDRLEDGNFGLFERTAEGVIELKIDYGPGYRLYVGEEGDDLFVLWGGVKKTQSSDFTRARRYWQEYKDGKKSQAKRR